MNGWTINRSVQCTCIYTRSGRGVALKALKKVLEEPLRPPGQHQATDQSTVETSSSVTQPTQQTSMMSGVVKPMGRCQPHLLLHPLNLMILYYGYAHRYKNMVEMSILSFIYNRWKCSIQPYSPQETHTVWFPFRNCHKTSSGNSSSHSTALYIRKKNKRLQT